MAAVPEPETLPPPPEPPIPTAPEPASVTEPEPASAVNPTADNAGPPRKRQRRPSVRLGEIGNQRAAAFAQKSHTRHQRLNMPPWSWRTPKEDSRTAKGRSNGGEESNVNGNGIRRGKAKRGSTAMKRLRSNNAPRTATITDDVAVVDDGDEGFRDFNHEESPVNSVQENGVDYWNSGQHDHHGRDDEDDDDDDDGARALDNVVESSDSREWMRKKSCEGVRTWLCDLGLSRYAPIFEIHEVDDELLPLLTLEDLKDMGINAVGSRRKMYTSIQKLRKGFP
ncbi:hypothetical protein RIF29_14205 [Crotalaria pallida]|uniref:SAM domain-containing protein n=1 Tax=Crotalaria pallida TaxID=3830 RepID=A0AAN9IBD9_CROPI